MITSLRIYGGVRVPTWRRSQLKVLTREMYASDWELTPATIGFRTGSDRTTTRMDFRRTIRISPSLTKNRAKYEMNQKMNNCLKNKRLKSKAWLRSSSLHCITEDNARLVRKKSQMFYINTNFLVNNSQLQQWW